MKKSYIKKYAQLIVETGANVQKGQRVIINASVEIYDFVKDVMYYCYKRKAKAVTVNWSYQPLTLLHNKYCSVKTLAEVPNWVKEKQQFYVDENPVYIHILSDDPDGLKGMDQAKAREVRAITYPIFKPYIDASNNRYQWVIAGYPSEKWAKKVFPELSKSKAREALLKAILETSRAYNDNPIEAWKIHNENLNKRVDWLNSLNLRALKYKSSNDTDFKVGLIDDALFMAGKEKTLGSNIPYNPNIPSEEVFTSPKKGEIDGVVYSSKPLSYNGEIIDDFHIVFENGKVKEVHARKNEELLKHMVSMDEGASFLGEVALVPFNSPINNTNILFFNTLYDENASCHLALGRGFENVIKDYEKYSQEELINKGINQSMIHVDFMIGSKDLNITGIDKNGKEIPIFINGNWAN